MDVKTTRFGFSAKITLETVRKNMANYAVLFKRNLMSEIMVVEFWHKGQDTQQWVKLSDYASLLEDKNLKIKELEAKWYQSNKERNDFEKKLENHSNYRDTIDKLRHDDKDKLISEIEKKLHYQEIVINEKNAIIIEMDKKLAETERSRDFGVKFFKDKCDKLLMSGSGEAEKKCIAEEKLSVAVEALEKISGVDDEQAFESKGNSIARDALLKIKNVSEGI